MPWDSGKDFAGKHNKKLHGHAADVAKTVANKVLSETGDEGKAIRIANSAGNRAMKKDASPKETIKKLYGKK